DPATTVNVATQAVIAFRVRGAASDLVTSYTKLIPGGAFPSTMKSVSEIGILEEYRFYVRQNYANATDLASKLTKARFIPGTNSALNRAPRRLSIGLPDNTLDFQVPLPPDRTNPVARGSWPAGVSDHCTSTTIAADPINCYISEASNGVNDDWLYNATSDDI